MIKVWQFISVNLTKNVERDFCKQRPGTIGTSALRYFRDVVRRDAERETLQRNIIYSPCAFNRLACLRPPQRAEKSNISLIVAVTVKLVKSGISSLRLCITRQALGMNVVIPYILLLIILKPAKRNQVIEGNYKGFQV